MRVRVSGRSTVAIIAAAFLVGGGIVALDARQALQGEQAQPQSQQPQSQQPQSQQPQSQQPQSQQPQGQQPAPSGRQPAPQEQGQQPPPADQQPPQGQPPPPEAPAAPTHLLLPADPALPLLSAGIHAARSTQPGREIERPYRGLFGGTAVGPGQPGMFATLSTFGAYDDNLLATQHGSDRPGVQAGGFYTGGSGTLEYAHVGSKLTMNAGGDGEFRYYEPFDDTTTSVAGHVVATFRVGRRNTFTGHQTVSRAELYRLGGFPGLEDLGTVPVADAEFKAVKRERIALDSFVGYMRELNSKSRITANYSYRRADTPGLQLDLRVHSAGASYERQMSRYATLNLGYFRQSATYDRDGELPRNVLINNLNIGGGYIRPLSFSRRTTIRLSGGTGMISRDVVAGAPPVDYFRLTGNAGVEHEMGRTWRILGTYTRGVQLIEGFADPFYLDSARVSTTGLLHPRVEFSAGFAYTDGRLALSAQQNPYSSLGGTVRVGYSVSTRIELSADYAYRQYQFDTAAGVPIGVPQDVGRNSVSVRFNYWLPIFTTR